MTDVTCVGSELELFAASHNWRSYLSRGIVPFIAGDDRKELEAAAALLRAGGRLIVLSPAHQRLFTTFDAAIGHFRRYNRPTLRRISPRSLRLEQLWYLDSAGRLLSVANRLFLPPSMPTRAQLRIWDDWVVPVSRILGTGCFGSVGKSIVGIWRREKA